jgi:hypothetical protein
MLSESEATLRAQGAVSVSPRGSWRLGWLSLGKTTLSFQQPGGRGTVRIDLGSVTRLDMERRKFVVCAKPVVRLTYRPGAGAGPRSCWLITAQVGDWEAALSRRIGLREEVAPAVPPPLTVTRELAAALAGLDGTAGLILDYLAHRGYATTGELMALVGAETEDAIFHHLHEGFRHVESALGGPAIRYEAVCFDWRSGVVRQQSWLIDEAAAGGWLASRVPADVLVENDELLVVTSMPTRARGALPSARVDTGGCGLVVSGTGGHDRWIALPEEVAGEAQCAISGTGTLVIRARRRAPGTTDQDKGAGGGVRRNAAASVPASRSCTSRQLPG